MKRALIIATFVAALSSPVLAQGVGVQVGPIGAGISFEPQQRTHIHDYVTRERVSPYVPRERVVVGSRLPADVELRSVPTDWGPHVNKYRYVYSNDRVYFVDPGSREVIYEME